MKIRAPDDIEGVADSSSEHLPKDVPNSFEEEIKKILKLSEIPEKFLLAGCDSNAPDFKLKVLMKFTELCREEIIPRHNKAMETIEHKSEEVQCKLMLQQRQLAGIMECRRELEEVNGRLEAARRLARDQSQALTERLKETLQKLQDCCKNKTFAEKKLAQDLTNLKKKADDLKVVITETSSKMNYYTTQMKVQTEMVRKNSKPLYLDNNRAIFMRKNLNTMRQNIEDLVRRVKMLNNQTSDIDENEISEGVSRI